jgi:hypothetical protein
MCMNRFGSAWKDNRAVWQDVDEEHTKNNSHIHVY